MVVPELAMHGITEVVSIQYRAASIQEAVEGSAQGDLEEKAGWDAFEGSMPVGQTAIEVRTVRGAQATIATHMVKYEDKVLVGDTTNVVKKDTGNTRGAPPLPGGAE